MLLEEQDVRKVLEQAKAAFPNFGEWQFINKKHPDYFGFSLWGEFVMEKDRQSSPLRRYFITLDTYESLWRGHLSIGLPCYLWSSCDFGDAMLLDTNGCETLAKAIAALKAEMKALFGNFSAT